MSDKDDDRRLAVALRNLSFSFSPEKHAYDLRSNPYYRENIRILEKKGYMRIEGNTLIITSAGEKLLSE